jgi:hypothetical protein
MPMLAAPGKVRPLRPPQLLEIAILGVDTLGRPNLAMPSKVRPRIATSSAHGFVFPVDRERHQDAFAARGGP